MAATPDSIAASLAEISWSPKGGKDFAAILPRLMRQGERWRRNGVQVADTPFAVDFSVPGGRGDALRKISKSGMLPLLYAHLFSLALMRDIFARQVQLGKTPLPQLGG